jgi:hypothetical protein
MVGGKVSDSNISGTIAGEDSADVELPGAGTGTVNGGF